jgi:tetratricopeptide (TPR) repeat protein
MIDRARALRPLQDAAPAIDRLETYESPAELAEALRATWHAVDATLRALLRADAAAPDELRMRAMSRSDLPHDALITELRRRDLVSLQLAGRVHELMQSAARAGSGTVRPGDADAASDVVRRLRGEIEAAAAPPAPQPSAEVDTPAEAEAAAPDEGADVARQRREFRRIARRPALLIGATLLLLVVTAVLVLLFGRGNEMAEGVEAFRAGRMGVAEQHFRAVLQRDDGNVTARLYLARILRAQGRQQEAADVLRRAADVAPRDPAVRRELGYLFLDLQRPAQAAQQFRQAVELDPAEPLGWVGLYEALVRADDPSAADWLRRAPAAAQAMIQTGRP